jgi:hypothetical protein
MSKETTWSLGVKNRPDLTALKKRLLKRGGEHFQRNDFLSQELGPAVASYLMKAGAFLKGKPFTLVPMEVSNCHANAAELAEADKITHLWTGLALSEDGCWRVHAWCTRRSRIIETTVPRTLYFGFDMGNLHGWRKGLRN